MATNNPLITVILPVYNGERFLNETIDSILNQTFQDFEVIIIDDCSQDQSYNIIQSYAQQDERIVIIKNEKNLGIAPSRNKALSIAKGCYIALINQDDINFPERFSKQIDYLTHHPDIYVLGTSYIGIDENGSELGIRTYPDSPGLMQWALFFGAFLSNPTLMMRSEIFKKYNYRYHQSLSGDYELWVRLIEFFKITNLKEPLLYFRFHPQSYSVLNKEIQKKASFENQRKYINRFIKKEINDDILQGIRHSECIHSVFIAHQVICWILKLHNIAMKWDIKRDEKKAITHGVVSKLHTVWHYQKYHPFLLPIMLYSSLLNIKSRLS